MSAYTSEKCTEIVEMGCLGFSIVQIAAKWKISKATIYRWKEDLDKPEFKIAFDISRTCSEAYYEELGQEGAKGNIKGFNATAWDKIMRARFKDDWIDTSTQKIELKNEIKSMTNQEIDEALKALLAQRTLNKVNISNAGQSAGDTTQ